jgi:DNA polymerase III epsilon subunit-like protein
MEGENNMDILEESPHRMIFFDLETTGLYNSGIIELAAVDS